VVSTVLIVIGGLTPPMAPLLYIAAAIAESPSLDALPLVLFLIAAMLVCVVVLVCFPALVTFLPRVVLRS